MRRIRIQRHAILDKLAFRIRHRVVHPSCGRVGVIRRPVQSPATILFSRLRRSLDKRLAVSFAPEGGVHK